MLFYVVRPSTPAGEVVESQMQDLADEKKQVCNGKMLLLSLQIGVTPVLLPLTGLGIVALLVLVDFVVLVFLKLCLL